jgi:hypothetical protein
LLSSLRPVKSTPLAHWLARATKLWGHVPLRGLLHGTERDYFSAVKLRNRCHSFLEVRWYVERDYLCHKDFPSSGKCLCLAWTIQEGFLAKKERML